ncbi:hypothetical protein DSLASN_02170 [Desulfoluna limicola]|uniref:pEK499-p136 HEPN domain-containing protein n=1 Tax=Desulfoluna limicola TaxID=2810562 RepID=A0ABN6EZB5_9BACT|nr:hypothetical protein [Desulfoluna limicola]BCS94585.1 hypothetical protein DSLASN_02170 [Desulfoluna limicola]
MPIRTTINGVLYTHIYLWEACTIQYQHLTETDKGTIFYEISTCILAHCALEAYINFVGEIILPEIWEQEDKPPFLSIHKKIQKIIQKSKISLNKRERPYQTIVQLTKIRNFLAHAKIDKYEINIEHDESEPPNMFHSKLYNEILPEGIVAKVIEDVESFCNIIHAACKPNANRPLNGQTAFGGLPEHAFSDSLSST